MFISVLQPVKPAAPVIGAAYYVSTSGNNANPGTIGSPKRNIAAALELMSPGETLYIRGGIYSQAADVIDSAIYGVPSGTSYANPIIISGFPGETVILQPANGVHASRLTNSNQYIIYNELSFDYIYEDTDREGIYISGGSHHIRHQRVIVYNCSNLGVVFASGCAGFCEFLNGEVYACGRNDIDLTRGHAFYISCADNLFQVNSVHNNAGYGYHIFENTGPLDVSRNVVSGNRIYSNGLTHSTAYGVVVNHGSDNLVYNNLIYGNKNGVLVYDNASNAQIYNNTIVSNIGGGIDLQNYSSAPIIRNNIVYLNGSAITDYGGTGTPVINTNVTTDPLFVDIGSNNFHLQSGSNARDAGVTLSEVLVDYDGLIRPQGSAYCIGAYEFV